MKSFALVAIFALLALSAVVAANEVVDLSTSLEGVWSIDVARTGAEQKFADSVEAPVSVVANFTRQSGHLVGAITSTDGEINVMVQITTDGPFAGSLYLIGGSSSDDEFDAGSNLFHFDLKNNTERTLVGTGAWVGTASAASALLSKPGVYQVTITDRNIFTFSVWNTDGTELTTVTGIKLAGQEVEQPWYMKFATPLIFIGAMGVSRLLRSFTSKPEQPAAEGAKATGAAAPAAKSKKD